MLWHGAPPVRTFFEAFSGRHVAKTLRLLDDLRQSLGTVGPLLGSHLVTMGVRLSPWGAM